MTASAIRRLRSWPFVAAPSNAASRDPSRRKSGDLDAEMLSIEVLEVPFACADRDDEVVPLVECNSGYPEGVERSNSSVNRAGDERWNVSFAHGAAKAEHVAVPPDHDRVAVVIHLLRSRSSIKP